MTSGNLATYYWYREHKICVQCGHKDAFHKSVLCEDCLYLMNERYHRQPEEERKRKNRILHLHRLAKVAKGICYSCNSPLSDQSKRYCEKHRLAHARRNRGKHKRVERTPEERAAIDAEHMRKLREGYKEYQKTERAKINNAKFAKLGKKINNMIFAKSG